MIMVPYKSVAAALVLAIVFGPMGVFYSSFLGGVVMSIFGLVSLGTMASMHSPLPMATVYLIGVIWAMAAVRCYNRKMLKIAVSGCLSESDKGRSFFRRTKKSQVNNEDPKETTETTEETASSWRL